MKKLCKIVMLPTGKATWPNCIWLGRISGRLRVDHSYDYDPGQSKEPVDDSMLPQYLYILYDDEIKEGDWMIVTNTTNDVITGYNKPTIAKWNYAASNSCLKIIAATESLPLHSITNSGKLFLPSIPQAFIDKYVSEYNKGNKIEEVLVEYEPIGRMKSGGIETHITEFLKLNRDNTINIYPTKDSWTRNEVVKLLNTALWTKPPYSVAEGEEWIESHLI